ncbi:MAG: GNAT family N-acetyltransferase [Anaeroplasma sp.]
MKLNTLDLNLCRIQGEMFEKSIAKLNCSSQIFIRRFMNSKLAESFDNKRYLTQSNNIDDAYDELEEEYGPFKYGKEKFSLNEMYWIGYAFRCMSIVYGLSSKAIYKMFPANKVRTYYNVFHTFDIVQATERMLETINYDFDDTIHKGLKIYQRLYYKQELELVPMTTELSHKLFIDFKNDKSLFKCDNDFKEYVYDKNKVDNYVSERVKKGYILLAIKYKDDVIGEIRFKKLNQDIYEIGIVLKSDRYKNKGIGTISIEKAIAYAKDVLKIKVLNASILLNNKRSQHVFEKNGFNYSKQDESFIYFYKIIG